MILTIPAMVEMVTSDWIIIPGRLKGSPLQAQT